MFKDIRMQNNGEVCEVVVISSHVPVTQETNNHDGVAHVLSSTTYLRDWKIWRFQKFVSRTWTWKTCLIAMIGFETRISLRAVTWHLFCQILLLHPPFIKNTRSPSEKKLSTSINLIWDTVNVWCIIQWFIIILKEVACRHQDAGNTVQPPRLWGWHPREPPGRLEMEWQGASINGNING